MEVVGEASDGLEAIEMVPKLSPHVVAMDVSMPRMNGIDATRRIKQQCPEVQVLALMPTMISPMSQTSLKPALPDTS